VARRKAASFDSCAALLRRATGRAVQVVALAAESGLDARCSAETQPKERDSASRVRENRLHGLMRGRAANAGYRLAALSTLQPRVIYHEVERGHLYVFENNWLN